MDAKYFAHLGVGWLTGGALLCLLNPQYKPRWTTDQVYAMQAFWRTLLTEGDRRGMMVNNRRAIKESRYLSGLAFGVNPESVTDHAKRARRESAGPRNEQQKEAYIFQKLVMLATLLQDGEERVLVPDAIGELGRADATVRSRVKTESGKRELLNSLSVKHSLVTAWGVRTHGQPLVPVVWTAVAPGDTVPAASSIGRAGGGLGCPLVRLVSADSVAQRAFVTEVDSVYSLGLSIEA